MALLTDMGGFPCAGLQVQFNPRVGMPFGPYSRSDFVAASGGENIMLLSARPRTLLIFKNGSLLSSGYSVSGTAVTFTPALTSSDTVGAVYDSLYPIVSPTILLPSTGDPLFANVQALLHFEGANGSTTFTDVIGNTWTPNASTTISTTWSAFGAASGKFDTSGAQSYISCPDSAALRPGSGDFCIEWQMNFTSLGGFQSVVGKGYVGTGDWLVQTDNGNGRLIIYMSGSAIATEASGTINTGQRYFCRVRRVGSTVTIERDGVVVATGSSSANLNSTAVLSIGSRNSSGPGGGNALFAFVDEFRLTIGNARSATTTQTTPWPDH